jgi:hypothetical protein
LLIRENIESDVNLGIFFPEEVDDEREIVSPKTFAGMNP